MTVRLTQELKERLFALYTGQRVLDATKYESGMICPSSWITGVLPLAPLLLRTVDQLSDGEILRIAVDMGISKDDNAVERVRKMAVMTSMWSNTGVTPQQLYLLRDLLISRGVAVDFMGLKVEDLVSAGWIKLTTPPA